MKKKLNWILILAAMASLTACGEEAGQETAGSVPQTETQLTAEATEAQTETVTVESVAISEEDETRVNDGKGWFLWDEEGKLTIEGRGAEGENAVVSSGKYEASQAGIEILQKGGNAVDAAIAVSFALGVVEPNASGIGGGGFMTIHTENGENVFVNFREKAPMAASPDMWEVDDSGNVAGAENKYGGKASGIPGNVRGMEYAFEHYGSGNVSWAELLEPAISLAENGFLVTPTLYEDMFSMYSFMMTYPEFGEVYLTEDDFNYEVGEQFRNPDLAETLRLIADNGGDIFYTGEMAQKIVDAVNQYGGVFSLDDLAGYEVEVLEPVAGTYRGYQIISSPLPSSGGTHVVQALNIMENFEIGELGFDSTERLHILTETFKLCYKDCETYMGDPNYVDVPINGILSKERAKKLADQITYGVAASYEEVDPWKYEHEDTTHFSVADADGNMVAVTQTINNYFGSGIIPEGLGFVMNNEMADFSVDPESPNAIAGGKVPLSSMSPTIVLTEEGQPFMVLGSPGGVKIITTVTEIISNVIDFDMEIQEAINAPRLYNGSSGAIQYESRMNEASMKELEQFGNELSISTEYNRTFGAVNAVMYREDGTLSGGADPRRDGKALAY